MVLQASFRSFLVRMNPELGISLKLPFKVRSSEVARILGPVICQKKYNLHYDYHPTEAPTKP